MHERPNILLLMSDQHRVDRLGGRSGLPRFISTAADWICTHDNLGRATMKRATTLIISVIAIAAAHVHGEHSFPDSVPIPAEAREDWVDVTDFGARPDDGNDDTEAFQRAFAAVLELQGKDETAGAFTLFIPAGVYNISDTLAYADDADDGALNLVGEDRATTILRLNDNAEGFHDRDQPRPIIQFWTEEENRNVPGGGMAFHNYVRNLTVDSGSGNPGAVGIDFYNHNTGGLRNVTIRSGDGAGVAGLSFAGLRSGVGLHWNVRIEGYKVGILADGRDFNGYTLRDIELVNQTRAAIDLQTTMWITIHRLRYEGPAPLLEMNSRHSTLNLIEVEARNTGGRPVEPIDYRNGTLFLQDVKLIGYDLDELSLQSYRLEGDTLVFGLNADTVGSALPDFEHLNAHHLFPAEPWLVKPPAPVEYPSWPQAGDDVRVIRPTDSPTQNRRNIQEAIDAGATDLFLQRAFYEVDGPIHLRNNIRRLHGGFGQLRARPPLATADSQDIAILIIEDRPETVIIEAFGKVGGGFTPNIINRSSGTVIIRDVFFNNARDRHYHNTGQGGTVVFENVKTRNNQRLTGMADLPTVTFRNGHRVLGWNFNPEQQQALSIVNDGGSMWIAGGKFGEREGPIILTKNGGTSILHGIWLNVGNRPSLDALLIFEDAFGYSTASFNRNGATIHRSEGVPVNPHFVREVRGGEERILETLQVAGSGWGAAMPYYFTPAPEGLDGVVLPEVTDFPRFVPERIRGVSEPPEPQAAAAAAAGQETELRLGISQNELVWNWEQGQGQGLGDWTRQTRSLELKAEEGMRFARIEDGQCYVRMALGAEVERVRYATRMRASEVEPTERQYRLPLLRLNFRDAEGERVGPRWEWLHLPSDAPWTDLENELDVPEGAVEIELRAGKTHSPAVVDYDHITLQAVGIRGMEQNNP